MPLGTSAKQDLQSIITLLNGVAYSSNAAALSAKYFTQSLEELINTGKTSASFNDMQTGFKNVANYAGLSTAEIKKYNGIIRQMASSGNLFGGTVGFQKNIFESLRSFKLPVFSLDKLKQDFLSLSTIINSTVAPSTTGNLNATQAQFNSLANVLERLGKGWSTTSNLQNIQKNLENVGKVIGLDTQQIAIFSKYLDHLAAIGKVPIVIQGAGIGGKGQQNITKLSSSGNVVADYENIFKMPTAVEQIPGGAVALDNVTKALGTYKSGLKDLTQVQADMTTGTTRWTGQLQSVPGIVREVNLVTGSMGQIIQSSARGFRSWGSAVARDISEFLKWSIAASVIYVPLRKLNELFKESVELQTKLADVQIAVGGSISATASAYESAAKVAAELGVHLAGVMDGYVLAYRAAGTIVEPTQRAALATKLLTDSMILSKLSGMEQASALDTLVGALRQLRMPLDQGVVLLDKWVAITKVANVDLKTLAESFAITATASENAGLSVDKLNAIIAVVAETTILSSTEAGNAVRAFMSGFTREESAAQLQQFGISVKNAAGELKSFDQISREVYERRQLGLIDDQAFAKLSETLGGRGARRGAQVQAYLSNLPRVEQLATVSLNAHGDAADALNIQLETLQTALNRLGVAFSNLARTLGAEGGFLDLFKNVTTLGTGLINIFSGITKALGTATPALIAFAAATLLLKKNSLITGTLAMSPLEMLSPGTKDVQGPGGRITRTMIPPTGVKGAIYGQLTGSNLGKQPIGQSLGGFFGAGGGAVGGAFTGLMMAAMSGAMSGALEGSKQDWLKTGAFVGSSIVGTILAGGNPIGGLIGATIVNSLIENLTNREVDLAAAFARALTPSGPKTPEQEEEDRKTRNQQLVTDMYKILGQTTGPMARLAGGSPFGEATMVAGAQMQTGKAIGFGEVPQKDLENYIIGILGAITGRGRPGGIASTGTEIKQAKMLFPSMSPKQVEELTKIYDEFIKGAILEVANVTKEIKPGAWGNLIKQSFETNRPAAGQVFGAQKETVTTQLGKGLTGVKDLQALLDVESGFAGNVSTIYAAMTADNKKASISFKDLAELIISLSTDESEAILNTANSIGDQINIIEELGAAWMDDAGSRKQHNDAVAEQIRLQGKLNEETGAASAGQKYQKYEQADYVEIAAGATPAQTAKLIEEAKRLSKIKLESITLDPVEQQKIIDSWGKVALATVDAVSNEWRKLPGVWEGIDKSLLSQAAATAGLLADSMKVSLETPDLKSSQFGQLKGNMEYYRKILESNPAGKALLAGEKPERMAIMFTDPVVKELVGSRILLSLALRDIIKNQEQQLEGIFNIPEGMTAMIPQTGKLFFSDQPIDRGGGAEGTLPNLGPAVDEFGSSTGTFTSAVGEFASVVGLMGPNGPRELTGAEITGGKNPPTQEEIDKMRNRTYGGEPRFTGGTPGGGRGTILPDEREKAKYFAQLAAQANAGGGPGGRTGQEGTNIFDQLINKLQELVSDPEWQKKYQEQLKGLLASGPGGGRSGVGQGGEQVNIIDEIMKLLQKYLGGKEIDIEAGMKGVASGAGPGGPIWNLMNTLLKKLQEGGALQGPVGDAGSLAARGAAAGITGWVEKLAPLLMLLGLGGESQNLEWAKSKNLPSKGGQQAPYPWLDPGYYQKTPEKYGGEPAVGSAVRAGLGVAGAGAANAIQPLSLPVTINTRIVNQTSVWLDGVKIQQAINDRQNTTLKTASRRAGTGGFVVEA